MLLLLVELLLLLLQLLLLLHVELLDVVGLHVLRHLAVVLLLLVGAVAGRVVLLVDLEVGEEVAAVEAVVVARHEVVELLGEEVLVAEVSSVELLLVLEVLRLHPLNVSPLLLLL